MGQKVHPYGFRVGITRPWIARWYAHKKDFGKFLVEDQQIKKFIKGRLKQAGLSKIEIERTGDETRVFLFTSRPGVVIGKKGAEIDKIREELQKFSKDGSGKKVQVNIREIAKPEMDAQLVAEGIAEQLLKRASFRRAVKKAVEATMAQGALGVKVIVAGRLGGAEIARSEPYMVGSLPLHTLTADVEYGLAEAMTNYGVIGVKCWIYKGKIVKEAVEVSATQEA
ncbi:MAG: 30S ribosomal protein S3 [Planctomycetota bacterium]|nr:30S ribosomal protein S3 [Planctomycetota bacterium]